MTNHPSFSTSSDPNLKTDVKNLDSSDVINHPRRELIALSAPYSIYAHSASNQVLFLIILDVVAAILKDTKKNGPTQFISILFQ